METVVNGSNQVSKNTKNESNIRSKPDRLKINNSIEYSHISFAICNECYWCASYMIDKAKPDGCPSCLGTKVRLISISNQ
jgi:rubrerythrin